MAPPLFWTAVRSRLGDELGRFALEAWLEPLEAEPWGEGLRLLCPSPFHRDRVRDRFLRHIEACAEAEAGRRVPIALEIGTRTAHRPGSQGQGDPRGPEARPAHASAACRAARSTPPPAKPVSAAPSPLPGGPPRQIPLAYRFESFVVGPCNALAREASLAIARGGQPGLDALFLAGGSGLGKTHLARAVVAAAEGGSRRALYVSAEAFTSEFQMALRGQGMPAFKRRFRGGCDLLVIEDVQFFDGKRATQLELFHTVQHLLDTGGRVVFTGDRAPAQIEALDPRLRSRMAAGLVAELEPPDAEVRRRILRAKAAAGGVRLPEECLELLVAELRGSVRDLEGALIQLVATASLLGRRIDRALAEAAVRKVRPALSTEPRPLEPEEVIAVAAAFFGTTPAALASRSRRRDVLRPRQLAMYLCRRYTDASLARIGRAFDRDHPAVSHAVATVERQILERAPLRYQVEALATRLEERTGRRPGAE